MGSVTAKKGDRGEARVAPAAASCDTYLPREFVDSHPPCTPSLPLCTIGPAQLAPSRFLRFWEGSEPFFMFLFRVFCAFFLFSSFFPFYFLSTFSFFHPFSYFAFSFLYSFHFSFHFFSFSFLYSFLFFLLIFFSFFILRTSFKS